MIDFIFTAILGMVFGIAFIAYATKRSFFTSFYDKCYEEMESQGSPVFGVCSGQTDGDDSCLDCPYFDVSILKKGRNYD